MSARAVEVPRAWRTRSLGRHRARSAALIAAVAAIGAAAIAAGATAEQEFADRQQWQSSETDLVEVIDLRAAGPPRLSNTSADEPSSDWWETSRFARSDVLVERPGEVSADTLADVAAVLGPVDWVHSRQVEASAQVPNPCWSPTTICSI